MRTLFRIIAFTLATQPAIAQEYGKFEGRLILEDVADAYDPDPEGNVDPGWTEFELLNDYSFVDSRGQRWTAPRGTVVNGASIPKAAWSIMGGPWSGRHRNAAVIHDYHCAELISNSETVHRLFYDGLRANGVSKSKAKVMYYAVLVGGSDWNEGASFNGVTFGQVTEEELQKLQDSGALDGLSLTEIELRASGQ